MKVYEVDFDRELLNDCDAQITIVVDSARVVKDQKHSLSGMLRRRVFWLKVVRVAMNKDKPAVDSG